MKLSGGHMRLLAVIICLLLCGITEAEAQLPRRGPRTTVQGGIMPKPDTLAKLTAMDSLLMQRADSLLQDTVLRDSLLRSGIDSLLLKDSLISTLRMQTRMDSLAIASADSLLHQSQPDPVDYRSELRPRKDTLSLSGVSWLSAIAPGFGQIYNKQYWKLPILYGTVGAGLTLFIHENNQYKPLKRQYDAMTLNSTTRTPELDALQTKMIRSNTRRQIYLGLTIASYIYFIGDAAINYQYDATPIKRATTLATICPGAGQIYNKSYWKLPFVVGGLASTIYVIDWNNRGYKRFKKAYELRAAYDNALNDPNIVDKPTSSSDEFRGAYSAEFLKNLKDNYRRNRDLSIIITAGLYILQIIDAHVDAHMKDYDISDDLSLSIEPAFNYTYVPAEGGNRPTFGFNISMKF